MTDVDMRAVFPLTRLRRLCLCAAKRGFVALSLGERDAEGWHGRRAGLTRSRVRGVLAIVLLLIFITPAHARDRFLDIREITSPGGIHAWFVEDHSVPVISLQFAFRGAGSALDPAGKQGLARLVSNTMDEGAGDLDSQAFQKRLADLSIDLSFDVSRDDFSGSIKTLTENRDEAFSLMALALASPRFDAEPLERMKAANLTRLQSSLSDPEWMAARLINDVAFEGHPYAMNSGGTVAGLKAVAADDLRAFVKNHLTRKNLVVAATGDISAEDLGKALDRIFASLPEDGLASDVPDGAVKNGGTVTLYSQNIPQTILEIMLPGIRRTDPDYDKAQVMNFILGGGGFGSRLMEEIREKRGLTYGIYSQMYLADHIQALTVSASTENKNAGQVVELTKVEMARMRETPVTEKELAEARSYLIGSMPLALSSTDAIAGLLLGLQLDRLPVDYLDTRAERLNTITVDDILKISQNLLVPDNLTVVLVGKPEGVTITKTVESLPNVE